MNSDTTDVATRLRVWSAGTGASQAVEPAFVREFAALTSPLERGTEVSQDATATTLGGERDVAAAIRAATSRLGSGDRLVVPEFRVRDMQKWAGHVVEVEAETFTAELAPEDPNLPTVHADFRIALLAERNIELGDVVYVTVRTVVGTHGYPHQTASVRLGFLGKWSEQDVLEIKQHARDQFQAIERFAD